MKEYFLHVLHTWRLLDWLSTLTIASLEILPLLHFPNWHYLNISVTTQIFTFGIGVIKKMIDNFLRQLLGRGWILLIMRGQVYELSRLWKLIVSSEYDENLGVDKMSWPNLTKTNRAVRFHKKINGFGSSLVLALEPRTKLNL